jgi:hypothetical protein
MTDLTNTQKRYPFKASPFLNSARAAIRVEPLHATPKTPICIAFRSLSDSIEISIQKPGRT